MTSYDATIDFHFELPPTFAGKLDAFTAQITRWQERKQRVVITTSHAQRLREILADAGLAEANHVSLSDQRLLGGFLLPDQKLVVLSDGDIFGWLGLHRRRRRHGEDSMAIRSTADLKDGDFVVHLNHGIGRYLGIVRQQVGGAENDYLLLQYTGSDRLYVPVQQLDRVQKYLGGEGAAPSLNSLGGTNWEQTKKRVKDDTWRAAKELAGLYAAREAATRLPYGDDSPWQREMEAAFDYEETPDQLQAILDVKEDLQREKPMDRLICGDVGFGKTEVAIRAAFKAVQEGKQVAVLCPTTVLAQQHWNVFRERLAAYPISIEMLSRFRTKPEQESVLESLRLGAVDLVIGTHRIVQQDVEFRDLGLVIVDEEQRFGVNQKEWLKKLRTEVDVLTLTATPIPRTLHMALGGLRELSLINDPPAGRMPIKTFVLRHNDDVARQAILRELERDGQVYYLYNRVKGIDHVAERLRKLAPTARIGVGHGQLDEEQLEEVMYDFCNHRYDVLLCTTIIENGLDIPNANTLIVERAELLGLAQLYQLRGRVGRSDRQAYAYFLYGVRGKLTKQADRRFDALREFSDLGSGFRIAMRDLEIRGAGNLLGMKQSGAMQLVGFDLYCDMLADSVAALRGAPRKRPVTLPEVDLPLPAFLPDDYIENLNLRVETYRKLANVENDNDVARLEQELRDRFGRPPLPVLNLLAVLRLRVACHAIGSTGVIKSEGNTLLRFAPGRMPTQDEAVRIYERLSDQFRREELTAVTFKLEGVAVRTAVFPGGRLLKLVEQTVEALREARPEAMAND